MVRRQLGRTGLAVAPIALGTTKLGRNTDVKYPAQFQLPSDEEVARLFNSALTLGVNLVDTAPAYGGSQERLGKLIQECRKDIVLCSKAGEQYRDGRSTYDFSAAAIKDSIEQSLHYLKTEYIDILLLHSDGRDVEILTQTDALDALYELKANGIVRAFGISAKTPAGIREAARTCDILMAPFSQRETTLGESLAEAHDRGLGILAIKGLYSGHLDAAPAIDFVLRHVFIDCLVVGTVNPAHLEAAVKIAENQK